MPRVLNVGIGVTRETKLNVTFPGRGAILRITHGDSKRVAIPPITDARWEGTLRQGDYILSVDSEARPRGDTPLVIETSVPVSFMSVQEQEKEAQGRSADSLDRSLVAWSGTRIVAEDPKQPWPPPPPPPSVGVAHAGFLEDSSICDPMLTLMDAYAGKSSDATPPVIHALLIGIDDYSSGAGQDGAIYRSLRGCVRDILEVEAFLLDSLQIPKERITRLITGATTGDAKLPTYENIVAAWKSVIDVAKHGDIIYIHYSGHGGRAATLFPGIKLGGLDESLAPCNINDREAGKYLRDVEIAALLAKSAREGMMTTLVLDSCHSGSATRGDEAQARRGNADDIAPRADQLSTSLVASKAELDEIAKELEHSTRGLEATWQLDAAGNESQIDTVIAACRQHESAYEYDDDDHWRGALSYFWLDTLRQRHAGMTYRDAYRRVFARVQGVFSAQSPLLLGAADRQVLGTARLTQPTSIAILDVTGPDIKLAAGASGLLETGARLAIIPHDHLPELVELSEMTHVEVVSTEDTTSIAHVVEGTGKGAPITLGSQAVIVSYAPRLQRSVRLLKDKATAAGVTALDELAAEIRGDTTKLVAVDGKASADYQVAVEASETGKLVFSILDTAGERLPYLRPQIAIGDPGAARGVKDRLVHLARFTNILNLTNSDPTSTLANKLRLTLHADAGGTCDPAPLPERPTLKAGTSFYLRIKNRSMRTLSIAVFDLASHWKIEKISELVDLDPNAIREIRLTASLSGDHQQVTDVLKVIATRSVTAFDWMNLPSLDAPPAVTRATKAGRRAPANPFESLMKTMQEPETRTRNVSAAATPTRDWTEARVTCVVVA